MKKRISILLHYTHKGTLGHTTRVYNICHELIKQQNIDLYLLQGGTPQPFIHFDKKIKLIPIPLPFDSRASFTSHNFTPHYRNIRKNFILNEAKCINPDIFITEFFPFGRQQHVFELLPAIQWLYKQKKQIYASIGYPCSVDMIDGIKKQLSDVRPKIMNFYTKIFIHTPEGIENPFFWKTLPSEEFQRNYLDFFQKYQKKTFYTGYILPSASGKTPQREDLIKRKKGDFLIIVSRGGGSVYPKIIINAIRAQALLGKKYHFIIACGPSTTKAEKKLFLGTITKQKATRTTLLDHIPDLDYFLKHADVSISLCGYNTSVQLMKNKTPSIVIPFVNHHARIPSNEQTARSLLLNNTIDSTILAYDQATPEDMARAVQEKCGKHSNTKKIPVRWFYGKQSFTKMILGDS